MKRWSTLLLSLTLFATAFAQTNAEREEAKRVILGDRKGSTSYPKSRNDRDVISDRDDHPVYSKTSRRYPGQYPTVYGGSREQRIYEINREYDAKIYSIRQNHTLSRYEKERIIRQLETERRQRLAQLNNSYRDRRYDNDDCNDNKKAKRNKGNHYGWSKGKGNPHHGK